MVIRVDIDDEEKQVSGVDWSLSWERVGRGWDWRGERRFPSKITKAKTMILQSSEQRKTQGPQPSKAMLLRPYGFDSSLGEVASASCM